MARETKLIAAFRHESGPHSEGGYGATAESVVEQQHESLVTLWWIISSFVLQTSRPRWKVAVSGCG